MWYIDKHSTAIKWPDQPTAPGNAEVFHAEPNREPNHGRLLDNWRFVKCE